jgi:ABC-2 type transport system permease protein
MEKYFRSLLLGIQNAMEYRANFLLSMVSAVFPIFIQYFLWTAIYRGSGNAAINGYTYAQIIIYTVIASIVSRLVRTGFEYEVNDDIKNGGLNKFIVKPIDYFTYKLACFIGQKLVQTIMIILLAAGIFFFLYLRFGFIITPDRLVCFFCSLLLAFLLNFVIFFTVGTVAFWLLEIGFLFEAVRIVIIAMSGGIFPLDIFGAGVTRVLHWMPFKYTINFPVEIINGKLDSTAWRQGLLIQAAWVFVFTLVSRRLWAFGTRRHTAVGG